MSLNWKIRGIAGLLFGGLLATFAWGETVELVTYFPTTAQAGDLHLRSLTVGDNISNVVLDDGELQVQERLGINVDIGSFDFEDRLVVGGGRDVVSQVLFLPGAGTASIEVGIGTDTPTGTLDIRSPRWNTSVQMGSFTNPTQGDAAGLQITSNTGALYGGHLYLVRGFNNKSWHLNVTPSDQLNFVETGVEDFRLIISPGGNVGIRTEFPLTSLHTSGMYIQPGGDATATNPLHRASAIFDAVSDDPSGYSSNYTGGLASFIALSYNNQPAARLGFYADAITGTMTNSTFYINTDPTAVLSWVSPSFVITDTGNVGIGTTNPQTPSPVNTVATGNLDVYDIYLRSTGQWVSQSSSVVSPYFDVPMNTVLQNTTGRMLLVVAWLNATAADKQVAGLVSATESDVTEPTVASAWIATESGTARQSITFAVPDGYYYRVRVNGAFDAVSIKAIEL